MIPAGWRRAAAAGLVTTVNGTPRILPDAPLRVDAIRRFDAKLDYTVRTVEGRDLPISNIGLKLDLDHGMLKLSPLTFLMGRRPVRCRRRHRCARAAGQHIL